MTPSKRWVMSGPGRCRNDGSGTRQPDPYETATRLSALQAQMEASFQVTAQLSQLTLSHYLPTVLG